MCSRACWKVKWQRLQLCARDGLLLCSELTSSFGWARTHPCRRTGVGVCVAELVFECGSLSTRRHSKRCNHSFISCVVAMGTSGWQLKAAWVTTLEREVIMWKRAGASLTWLQATCYSVKAQSEDGRDTLALATQSDKQAWGDVRKTCASDKAVPSCRDVRSWHSGCSP